MPAIGGSGVVGRPPRHRGKNVLAVTASLAVVGAFLVQFTNGLANRCATELNAGAGTPACSGITAMAQHAQLAVAVSVAICAALAVIAFIWYMFWGYKAA